METGELLSKATGDSVEMCPKVSGKNQKVSTPDYILNGSVKWDKKRPEGKGKDAIRDMVKNCEEQANKFIVDLSLWKGNEANGIEQAEKLFTWSNTKFIEKVTVIKDNKIVKAMSRK